MILSSKSATCSISAASLVRCCICQTSSLSCLSVTAASMVLSPGDSPFTVPSVAQIVPSLGELGLLLEHLLQGVGDVSHPGEVVVKGLLRVADVEPHRRDLGRDPFL